MALLQQSSSFTFLLCIFLFCPIRNPDSFFPLFLLHKTSLFLQTCLEGWKFREVLTRPCKEQSWEEGGCENKANFLFSTSRHSRLFGRLPRTRWQGRNGNQSHSRQLYCLRGIFVIKGCCPLLQLLHAAVNLNFTVNLVLTLLGWHGEVVLGISELTFK